jgi:predicted phosphoribosyltransferase
MAKIVENTSLKGKRWVFKDRADAGRQLVPLLQREVDGEAVVLAIPSGGVPVGLEIAHAMSIPFDMIIVRKVPIPGNPEAGFGAVTLEGDVFLNEALIETLGLTPSQIDASIARVREKVEMRNRLFRRNKPPTPIRGRTAILVDDGLASGYTMMASIDSVRRADARKILVAVPTAPMHSIQKIAPLVDTIICLNIREGPYFAVAEAYDNWYDLSEDEVLERLSQFSIQGSANSYQQNGKADPVLKPDRDNN